MNRYHDSALIVHGARPTPSKERGRRTMYLLFFFPLPSAPSASCACACACERGGRVSAGFGVDAREPRGSLRINI